PPFDLNSLIYILDIPCKTWVTTYAPNKSICSIVESTSIKPNSNGLNIGEKRKEKHGSLCDKPVHRPPTPIEICGKIFCNSKKERYFGYSNFQLQLLLQVD
ncbi:27243_t:CDS:2, partial [Racocetra persica]